MVASDGMDGQEPHAAPRAPQVADARAVVHLIGGYCLVSVMLNASDMSVPGSEEGLG